MRTLLDNENTMLILRIVEKYKGLSYKQQNIKTRKRHIVVARQLTYHLHYLFTKHTLAKIGSLFKQDHATVLHANKTISNLLDTETDFKRTFNLMKEEIIEGLKAIECLNKETKEKVFKTLLCELQAEQSVSDEWTQRFIQAI